MDNMLMKMERYTSNLETLAAEDEEEDGDDDDDDHDDDDDDYKSEPRTSRRKRQTRESKRKSGSKRTVIEFYHEQHWKHSNVENTRATWKRWWKTERVS